MFERLRSASLDRPGAAKLKGLDPHTPGGKNC